jgi:hypothetical protein
MEIGKFSKLNALIFVVGISYAGYHHWQVSRQPFLEVPAMENVDPRQVVVFAPENCPSKKARRADDLARQLNAGGIPAIRTHHVSFASSEKSPVLYANLNTVMDGDLPIVFVKGKGKGNPSFDQIQSEYRGGH